MELLDILHPDGSPTGKTKPKAEVHRDGDWHLAAHVWISNGKGDLLLQRRALVKENDPGLWDISVAGHVSAGESARVSAVREVQEEIGLEITEEELTFLFRLREPRVLLEGRYIDNEWHEVFLLKKDVDTRELVLQESEVAAVAWVPVAELEERVAKRKKDLVPHWEEYSLLSEHLR